MDNTNYVYLNYFIDSGYKMGLGWAEANVEEVNNFQVESCLFWKSLGFKIREPKFSSSCPVAYSDKDGKRREIYLHPMEFSASIPLDEIEYYEELLKNANMDSFKYQGRSRTISLKNWSDEEYIEYLKSQAKDIISDLKKVYKPGRSFDPFCYPKHLEILEKYKVKTFDHHLGRSSGDLDILYLNNLYKSLERYPVIYKYPFKLGYEIKGDFIKEAQNDLTSYEMIEFLPDEMSCKNDILNISWVLDEASHYDSVQNGNVIVITSKHLSEEDLKNLESWIDGQNGDGIGEGFEQQEWKHFEYNDEDDEYDWELCTIRSKGHLTESSDTLSEYETHITEFDINQYLNNNDNNFEMTL